MNTREQVSNNTNTIGLIIPDIKNPFFAILAKNIEIKLQVQKYSLILMNTDDVFLIDRLIKDDNCSQVSYNNNNGEFLVNK